ncbi:GlxA family transcriptional regulator [Nocardia sp. NPDC127579]|uniref:GlxA family transcriptional regulator n=1 Tax=Nocardia sp. NPDC127579 TaxID=3345402 RepID=UPI003642FF61
MDVSVFVMDEVADFGLAALLETFGMANALREELTPVPEPWHIRTVALGASIRSSHGYLVPTTPLSDLPHVPRMMIVPAVNVLGADDLVGLVSAPANQPLLEQIREVHESGAYLAAACTGTFFLAEAGVLDASPATTSWWLGPTFRRRYPRVVLDEGRTLCRGPRVTTAGASLSHMDLALSLVHSVSPALVELVVRYLAVGNRATQSAFALPEVIARGNSLTAGFERWVRGHLSEQFRISQAAAELGVTERSLQRATHAELGMSPRDFVNDIRLDQATHLLRTTNMTVDTVAARVGYLNAGTLRALVRRRRGISITELRDSRFNW